MSDRAIDAVFLKSAICGMTDVARTNQGWEITLPQAYHTGHAAVVVVAEQTDGFLIHDNSYAAMLLAQLGHSVAPTSRDALDRAIQHYGCEVEGLKVFRKCEDISQVALSAVLVGCASRLIADQALESD